LRRYRDFDAAENTGTAKRIQRIDQDQVLIRASSNPTPRSSAVRRADYGSTSILERL
jgi:hypothetical protein